VVRVPFEPLLMFPLLLAATFALLELPGPVPELLVPELCCSFWAARFLNTRFIEDT